MRIAFYDTKPYDKVWFPKIAGKYGYEINFLEARLSKNTVILAQGCDAVCVFVNDDLDADVINALSEIGIGAVLMRCAGYDNVDLKAAEGKINIMRVPSYSPTAVAEFAVTLLMAVNRCVHRAYQRTKEFNFNINGLMGMNLRGKTAGVVGTGKIGRLVVEILKGMGMNVIAYDPYPDNTIDVEYVSLEELFMEADAISLHCPLTELTEHIINKDAIAKMKEGVILVNTSRGGLVDTAALICGLKSNKFIGVALDVYEEEDEYFFEDRSNDIITDDELARLSTFPNVLITSHQAFFTKEAMQAIAETTIENLREFEAGDELTNAIAVKKI